MSERVPLLDAAGRTLATYHVDERDGRPWADRLEPAPRIPQPQLIATIMTRLAGHGVASTVQIGDALIAAGATRRRRALTLHHPLAGEPPAPPVPDGITIVPFAHGATDLHPASLRAFPIGHADRDPASSDEQELADLERLLRGDMVGPVLPASHVATSPDHGVVGAAIVTDRAGEPPSGGPWVAWIFRDPEHAPPGTGAAVLGASITALTGAGAPGLGLAVTDGNPAQGVYERLGFTIVARTVSVLIGPLDASAAV